MRHRSILALLALSGPAALVACGEAFTFEPIATGAGGAGSTAITATTASSGGGAVVDVAVSTAVTGSGGGSTVATTTAGPGSTSSTAVTTVTTTTSTGGGGGPVADKQIPCGAVSCPKACCIQFTMSGPSFSCAEEPGQCSNSVAALGCDNTSDCPGAYCCGVASFPYSASCQTSCNGFVLCKEDSECTPLGAKYACKTLQFQTLNGPIPTQYKNCVFSG